MGERKIPEPMSDDDLLGLVRDIRGMLACERDHRKELSRDVELLFGELFGEKLRSCDLRIQMADLKIAHHRRVEEILLKCKTDIEALQKQHEADDWWRGTPGEN